MDEREMVRLSKKMSYILRHGAKKLEIDIDSAGWVGVGDLLSAMNKGRDEPMTIADVEFVVAHNDKKRFAMKGGKIRASQGHSIDVDLAMVPVEPPAVLYHGTGKKAVPRILAEGLKKMGRNHVHLSKDGGTAFKVGSRHGSPVVFEIASGEMHLAGHDFYLSENGVWLVDHVPARYLKRFNKEKKKN